MAYLKQTMRTTKAMWKIVDKSQTRDSNLLKLSFQFLESLVFSYECLIPDRRGRGTDKAAAMFCDAPTLWLVLGCFSNQRVRGPPRGWALGQVLSQLRSCLTLPAVHVRGIILPISKMRQLRCRERISLRSHSWREAEADSGVRLPTTLLVEWPVTKGRV